MRPERILHPQLAAALSTLGHTDIILVTDAGFPIPANANRIDLGFWPGIPDVTDILRVLRQEVFVEDIQFAREVRDCNPICTVRYRIFILVPARTLAKPAMKDCAARLPTKPKLLSVRDRLTRGPISRWWPVPTPSPGFPRVRTCSRYPPT